MIRLLQISILAALLLLATGCSSDSIINTDPPRQPSDDEIHLSIDLDCGAPSGTRAEGQTPSASSSDEVTDVVVMLFSPASPSSNIPGTLRHAVMGINLTEEPGYGIRRFDARFSKIEGADRLVVLAFANGARWFESILNGVAHKWSYDDVVANVKANISISQRRQDVGAGSPSFTMWGIGDHLVDTSLDVQPVRISLWRDMAKYTVKLKTEVQNDFAMTHSLLYNRNETLMCLPPSMSLSSDWSNFTYPSITPDSEFVECGEYPESFSNSYASLSAYVAEQELIISGNDNPADHRLERPALIVGGYYHGNTSKVYWYRVDFKDADGKLVNLLRNHHYIVNVTSVNGPGEDTPQEAYESQTIHASAEVVEWIDMSQDVEFDGSNWIAAPSHVKLGTAAGASYALRLSSNVDVESWEYAWASPGTAYDELTFTKLDTSHAELACPNGDFAVEMPDALDADGFTALTIKALTALPLNQESRSKVLYINVTPRLRMVVNIAQGGNSDFILPDPWGEGNFWLEY